MIIIDERNFLQPLLEDKGFAIFDFFENCEVLNLKAFTSLELKRRADFVLVDTETVLKYPQLQEEVKTLLNTFVGAIFFHDHSNEKAQEWVKNEGALINKIIGQHSLPMAQLDWTILSNQLQFMWSLIEEQRNLQKHMIQFSLELDQVLQNAESEMSKARQVHETLIPRRSEEIKGILFTNKYAAGEGGGIEFIDLHQSASKVYQILISTESYLASSAMIGILSQHKEGEFSPSKFLDDCMAELGTINSARKKKANMSVIILEVDLSTLKMKYHGIGEAEVYSQVKGKLQLDSNTEYQMQKGEKVIVFSSGFLFNWNEGQSKKNIGEFVKEHASAAPHQLLSEAFFELKEGRESRFLDRDATVLVMEVNKHGIHKV
jgi:hypothetical protein